MKEYIEREAAITAIAHRPHVKGWDDYEDGLCRGLEEAVNAICAIPAADVRPVVRGRWKHDKDGLVWCLNCGFGKERSDERTYHFCPNCGADMREER